MEKKWQQNSLGILRIITGLLMSYHGWEVFDAGKMMEYASWDSINNLPAPLTLVYVGKGAELVSGVLLTMGLLTRAAAFVMAADMLFICFKVGGGKFYYEDQHPFIFAMMAIVFIIVGSASFGLDQLFFKTKKN